MAEIKIEKKKPVWPWILAVLVILIIIYFFWSSNSTERRGGTEEIDFTDTISLNDRNVDPKAVSFYKNEDGTLTELEDYILFLNDSKQRDQNTESYFHRTALNKLIDATREQAVISGVDVEKNLETAEENAKKVTHNVHNAAGYQIKKASVEITAALKKIQEKDFANLESEVENLEETIDDMNGMRAIDDQQERIFAFHNYASELLRKMGETEMIAKD